MGKLYPNSLSPFSVKKFLPCLWGWKDNTAERASQHGHFLEAAVYLSVLPY